MGNDTKTEPLLHLTEDAARQVQHLQETQPDNTGKHLRVFVESGGCSGMQYGLVFDEQRENDHIVEAYGVSVLVDAFSKDYLKGSTVDFSDSLNAGGFKITNPKASETCGCGRSFK